MLRMIDAREVCARIRWVAGWVAGWVVGVAVGWLVGSITRIVFGTMSGLLCNALRILQVPHTHPRIAVPRWACWW